MRRSTAFLWLALSGAPACVSMDGAKTATARMVETDRASAAPSQGFVGGMDAARAPESGGSGGEAPLADARKRVYIGEFTVLPGQIETAIARFLAEVESAGGFVESRVDAQIVARVPAERFAAMVTWIPQLGRVLRESVRTQDVTTEWVDLDVRIKNAEVARQRLLALLERATDVKDVLAIEEQLRRLTTEIEQMKAQFKLLESQVAYSRLTITFEGQAPPPVRRATGSRFAWVNQVGIEAALRRF